MENKILLVTNNDGTLWKNPLIEAVKDFGKVFTAGEMEAEVLITNESYDLIIVDMVSIGSSGNLISRLKMTRPEFRIVAATAIPSWKEARDVLKSGANDCFLQTYDVSKLKALIKEQFEKFNKLTVS